MKLRPKIIEESDTHKVVSFPFWANEDMIRRAISNVERDAAVLGFSLRFTLGHRLLRIEGDMKGLEERKR